ncbi:MAG: hypothetical protein ABW203_01780 [Novosphingobium sp.]
MIVRGRLQRCLAAATLASLLGGCVAVAIPVVAGGALLTRGGKHRATPPALSRPPVEREALPARLPASAAVVAPPAAPPPATAARAGFVVTTLTELPPPSADAGATSAGQASRWDAFVAYALASASGSQGKPARSALVEASPTLASARPGACKSRHPAVIIDLDPAQQLFAADGQSPASPAIADHLQRLRRAGVAVLWLSEKPADNAAAIAAALKRSGLDPDGADPLVLPGSPGERKQVLRARAGLDRCVIAIAGDQDSDFDELFDYLRDPAGADAYRARLGAGWFLVPPPLG